MGGLPCRDWSYGPDRVFESRNPSWAPDGRRVLFDLGAVVPGGLGVALADADGEHREAVPLAPPQPEGAARSGPSFGPDGRHFAYQLTLAHSQPAEIWMATIDGLENRRLGRGRLPRWSPDGRAIAYVADGGATHRGTWLMSARTGRPVRRLWKQDADSLDWAPDGRRLIAASAMGLFILRADGRGARRLGSSSTRSRSVMHGAVDAVWSPDGRRLAFVRNRAVPESSGESGTRWEIWTSGLRGRRARRIWHRTDGFDSDDPAPPPLAWQPARIGSSCVAVIRGAARCAEACSGTASFCRDKGG
jgi:Tol biopolymer transport system component